MRRGFAQHLHRRLGRQQIELQRLDSEAPVVKPAGDQHMAPRARHLIEEFAHGFGRCRIINVIDHQKPAGIGLHPVDHRLDTNAEIGRVLVFDGLAALGQ